MYLLLLYTLLLSNPQLPSSPVHSVAVKPSTTFFSGTLCNCQTLNYLLLQYTLLLTNPQLPSSLVVFTATLKPRFLMATRKPAIGRENWKAFCVATIRTSLHCKGTSGSNFCSGTKQLQHHNAAMSGWKHSVPQYDKWVLPFHCIHCSFVS